MALPTTEQLHPAAAGIDRRAPADVARVLAEAQVAAAGAVLQAIPAIADAADAMATCMKGGGRLYYVGAGSSGLMAAADALELGGTFGIAPDRIRILMAGGWPTSSTMPGATEDDVAGLDAALADAGPGDVAIAVAASGTTPFTLAAARLARARGARLIGLTNNAGAALLELADLAVLLPTPPEVLSGSTRLGAGTAQKIALNTMSTLMAVRLGHVYDGMMVNVVADNEKLRRRATGIVQCIAETDALAAGDALALAGGDVKLAVLLAAGAASPGAARAALDGNGGNLRGALEGLRET